MPLEICQFSAIHYQLKRSSRRRSVSLQIRQGQLAVLAPDYVDKLQIDQFVALKQQWIKSHLQRQATVAAVPDYLALQQLPLLDEQLQLKIVPDSHNAVCREGMQLWVQLSKRVKAENRQAKTVQLLQTWYQQQAQSWFNERVAFWQQQMAVSVTAVEIKSWKQKWGTCSVSGVVSFNWRLMLAPSWIADYVVVHELAHRRHMDHSPAFWQLLTSFYPQAKAARSWFLQHQHLLVLSE
ncbi:M48 family peptidase [Rheinheimera riviphila]|uniref:M48 family peptidase n=1 Tax=Rheinheimera riviphila TaxID=1834037 RepID=A0A437R353_9GAMM|nr:SprT family zinc-dependent metalloprotease [Rheinheimera riviphila]RVU41165.1 M48 family peptidase [Rheinheimera riviphila]